MPQSLENCKEQAHLYIVGDVDVGIRRGAVESSCSVCSGRMPPCLTMPGSRGKFNSNRGNGRRSRSCWQKYRFMMSMLSTAFQRNATESNSICMRVWVVERLGVYV